MRDARAKCETSLGSSDETARRGVRKAITGPGAGHGLPCDYAQRIACTTCTGGRVGEQLREFAPSAESAERRAPREKNSRGTSAWKKKEGWGRRREEDDRLARKGCAEAMSVPIKYHCAPRTGGRTSRRKETSTDLPARRRRARAESTWIRHVRRRDRARHVYSPSAAPEEGEVQRAADG